MNKRLFLTCLYSGLALTVVPVNQAQTITYVVGQFNTSAPNFFDNQQWGTAVPAISWDGSQNATTAQATNIPGSRGRKGVGQ